MLLIMNSAMMPRDGSYSKKTISKEEAKKLFLLNKDNYKSYVGYPNACRCFFELTGVKIPISRETTEITNQDTILCLKLSYRVNPNEKKSRLHGNNLEDYEFSKIRFFENLP